MFIVIFTVKLCVVVLPLAVLVQAQCTGGPLSLEAGTRPQTISSPGYNNGGYNGDQSCTWIISTDSLHTLLYSLYIDQVPCSGDRVEILYGSLDLVENPGSICGTNVTFGPFSDNPYNNMTLVFTATDTNGGGKGFTFSFLSAPKDTGTVCFETAVLLPADEETRFITSDNFPGDYPGNTTCEWYVVSSNTSRLVLLEVMFMDIETTADCSLDYLQITNVQSTTVRRSCDKNSFSVVRHIAPEFSIRFVSDELLAYKGFLIQYRMDDEIYRDCSNNNVDVAFLIDSTSVAGEAGLDWQLSIVKDTVAKFDVSKGGSQFSAVAYGDVLSTIFRLDTYNNTEKILNVTFPYIESYGRATHAALEFAGYGIFCTCAGARADSSKVIVIFSFGKSDSPERTRNVSTTLHGEGVHIISIGVGESVDEAEVTSMASDDQHALVVKNYRTSFDLADFIQPVICNISDKRDTETSTSTISATKSFSMNVTSSVIINTSQTVLLTSVLTTEMNSADMQMSAYDTTTADHQYSTFYTQETGTVSPSSRLLTVTTDSIPQPSSSFIVPTSTYSVESSKVEGSFETFSTEIVTSTRAVNIDSSSIVMSSSTTTVTTGDKSNRTTLYDSVTTKVIVATFVSGALFILTLSAAVVLCVVWCIRKSKNQDKRKNDSESELSDTPYWISMADNFAVRNGSVSKYYDSLHYS